ncbi:MAG: hypothetical protein DDT19_01558 [Syntrophomonadaceae bacterium]|nr:hypothetical protein [Bacillota bacterium]
MWIDKLKYGGFRFIASESYLSEGAVKVWELVAIVTYIGRLLNLHKLKVWQLFNNQIRLVGLHIVAMLYRMSTNVMRKMGQLY